MTWWQPLVKWVPASWWQWKLWRYLNPIHVVLAIPYAAVFRGCGFETVLAQLAIIGVTHELGDGDFEKAKTPTAPWEGIKDVYSFVAGGLLYYLGRLVF